MSLNQDQIVCLYRNLLYIRDIAPINICYTLADSLYDNLLESLDIENINLLSNNFDDNCIENHIIFANNPTTFVQQSQLINRGVNKAIFFHDDRINYLKKEDLYLFINQISRYPTYTFDQSVQNTIKNATYIRYGFKPKDLNTISNRSKNILYLANKQNLDLIIHSNIKSIYPDTDIIFIEDIKSTDIEKQLLDYKICICMNSDYNNLLAASCGCVVLSKHNHSEIPHFKTVDNPNNLLQVLREVMSSYDTKMHSIISESVTEQYSYEIFINTIKHIALDLCKKTVIL